MKLQSLIMDLINLLDSASVASTIGKAAIVVLVMFSYPLQVHPCRASIDAVLRWRPSTASARPNDNSPSRSLPLMGANKNGRPARNDTMSETRFAAITTFIIVLSYIVAMTVSSLEKVLAYVGSTGSTSISFILPGLFFYKISSSDSPQHQRLIKEDDDEDELEISGNEDDESGYARSQAASWRREALRKSSLALAIYGMVVMIVCLITNTYTNTQH